MIVLKIKSAKAVPTIESIDKAMRLCLISKVFLKDAIVSSDMKKYMDGKSSIMKAIDAMSKDL